VGSTFYLLNCLWGGRNEDIHKTSFVPVSRRYLGAGPLSVRSKTEPPQAEARGISELAHRQLGLGFSSEACCDIFFAQLIVRPRREISGNLTLVMYESVRRVRFEAVSVSRVLREIASLRQTARGDSASVNLARTTKIDARATFIHSINYSRDKC
jgi:hypothetical protein